MIQSARKTSAKLNEAELAAFVSKEAEIDAMLTIQTLSEDHFNTNPDEVTCAAVGSLEAYAQAAQADHGSTCTTFTISGCSAGDGARSRAT